MFSVKIFVGFVFPGACGKNRNAMLYFFFGCAIADLCFEITDKSIHAGDGGILVKGDESFRFDFMDQFLQKARDHFTLVSPVERQRVAPEQIRFFDQVYRVALAGHREGRRHTGDAAAHHEGGLCYGQVRLL